jgi:hypothetical protein
MESEQKLAELYPDGRMLIYEGDKPLAFIMAMHRLGLTVEMSVLVPPEKLHEVQSHWPVGT